MGGVCLSLLEFKALAFLVWSSLALSSEQPLQRPRTTCLHVYQHRIFPRKHAAVCRPQARVMLLNPSTPFIRMQWQCERYARRESRLWADGQARGNLILDARRRDDDVSGRTHL